MTLVTSTYSPQALSTHLVQVRVHQSKVVVAGDDVAESRESLLHSLNLH